MNQLILIPKSYGATLTLESRDLMFDVSDFLSKYFRYAHKPRYANPQDIWREFMRSNGAVGMLYRLKEKYGVKNYLHFYCGLDKSDNLFMAVAHIELLNQFVKQQFDSPYKVEMHLDENGLNWQPDRYLPLPLISENVSETFLSIVPGKSRDDKVYWINNAICIAAFNHKWESLPYVKVYEDEQKIIDDLCADVTARIDSGLTPSIEALKKHLAQIWYDKNGPSIFKHQQSQEQ